MQKYKYFFQKITGCLMLTVLLLCGCAGGNDLEITTVSQDSEEVSGRQEAAADMSQVQDSGMLAQENGAQGQIPGTAEDVPVYVQVTGAVRNPGVYELPKGSRVFEAVQKAGGMTDDAAAESLNQALEVSDGQMLVLYTKQEWEQMQAGTVTAGDGMETGATQEVSSGSGQNDGRININTASAEQLCSISGIGQSRAQSIITYREQNGAFGSIEEIMNVSGIKDGLFQKIKDKIKV